jgi:hypothetical protein
MPPKTPAPLAAYLKYHGAESSGLDVVGGADTPPDPVGLSNFVKKFCISALLKLPAQN